MRLLNSTPATSQSRKTTLIRLIPYAVAILALLFLPSIISSYYLGLLTRFVIFSIFALSLDFILGYTGLNSLGHASYLGVGGYTVGILIINLGMNNMWVIPIGILAAGIVACIFGFFVLRLKHIYFLLITLAFGQLLFVASIKWRDVTGGTDGLIGIKHPELGIPGFVWTDFNFYYFVLIVFVICYYIMHLMVNSPFGHALVGIRENEPRMQSLGYNTWLYKYISFIIGGIFGGVAGALFAPFYGSMSPNNLSLVTTTAVLLMVVIGGPGTLWGPVLGALIVVFLEHFSSVYAPERWPLILGIVFILCVMFLRGGVSKYLNKLWGKINIGGNT
jgi:branched-chain amino acid transport system permease protein